MRYRSVLRAAVVAIALFVGCNVYDPSLRVDDAGTASAGNGGANTPGGDTSGGSASVGGSLASGGTAGIGGAGGNSLVAGEAGKSTTEGLAGTSGRSGTAEGGNLGNAGIVGMTADGSSGASGAGGRSTGGAAGVANGAGSGGSAGVAGSSGGNSNTGGSSGNASASGGAGAGGSAAGSGAANGGTSESGGAGSSGSGGVGANSQAGMGGGAGLGGAGGSGGAAPASGCAYLSVPLVASSHKARFVITLANSMNFSNAIISMRVYVKSGTGGVIANYVQDTAFDVLENSTPAKLGALNGWRTLTWSVGAQGTGSTNINLSAVYRIGIEINADPDSSWSNPTLVYVDSLTVSAPALSFPFSNGNSVNTTPSIQDVSNQMLWQNAYVEDTTASNVTLAWAASCP